MHLLEYATLELTLCYNNNKHKQPPEVFHKKGVLKNLQNSQENTCVWVSFLIKLQAQDCKFI